MLTLLPDLKFPITAKQFDRLMENVVQLNGIDAGIHEPVQRALGIMLHCHDLWCKSEGRIDYRRFDGHARLFQDAMTFAGPGNPVATRHGDLSAAHLAIDFSDTQVRLAEKGLPLLSADVNDLINQCRDLSEISVIDEKRIGLLLDMLGKKAVK